MTSLVVLGQKPMRRIGYLGARRGCYSDRSARVYQFIWPHVRRKAEAIVEMLSAKEPILRPIAGSVLPALKGKPDIFLVADPSENGLIMGRMDLHKPILYVNAVSYLGLIKAASIAERIGRPGDALRWRGEAVELGEAWRAALSPRFQERKSFNMWFLAYMGRRSSQGGVSEWP